MSYGISVNNSSGHKIIQDTAPIYALKRSGTISASQFSNQGTTPYTSIGLPHLYGYSVANTGAAITKDEEVFFKVNVGDWISYHPWNVFISDGQSTASNTLNSSVITSTMAGPISFYVFDRMDNITGAGAASGYGAQVFNASGDCMWDSNEITNRVSKGIIAGSTTNITSDANAASIRSWYLTISSGTGNGRDGHTNINGWYIKRNSTTSWTTAVGPVDYGFYPYQGAWYNFSAATTFITGDSHVLLAHV